ncbi:hypothetical protein D9757_009460 [Collybiopsis confluens]|uniref:DUF1348-domain-containing protein n=1 Tax=Collybiopsis confluens TaxID=2823264 RepID=A0A8H5H4Y8_9AGAR|nr:hypothetical protein D9757_009460 [Collybiopsis confluens]
MDYVCRGHRNALGNPRTATPFPKPDTYSPSSYLKYRVNNSTTSRQMSASRLLLPPYTLQTALQKVKLAQKAWNTRDPAQVSLNYTADTIWRNRDTFLRGREEVVKFLTKKWEREHFYVLRKELFAFKDEKIAVQFFYEWNEKADGTGQWFRTYGLEDWTFDRETGLMRKRAMSGNDVRIEEEERWFKRGVDYVEDVEIGDRDL